MEVRTGLLAFPRARDIGPRTELAVFNFPRSVRQAVAGLVGTNFGFSPNGDRPLGKVIVRLDTSIEDDLVKVVGTFGVRDWSNEWDDDYEGNIQFVLLAELEDVAAASNLTITGVEYNQAIQYFRSKLDPATARPDNSVGLIAGKDTVLRIYVDTQRDPALPTITAIFGLLEIRLPASATWTPIMPLTKTAIPPRSDSAINRRNPGDTLNFLIPAVFSAGDVDFRVHVFDFAHANQPGFTSGQVQGTLQFTAVAPLSIRGVGIHYIGKGSDIPAPDVIALSSTLDFVRKTYPVGEIFISGFDTITYGGDFTDSSGDGCGSGWDGLLSKLREIQGDSTDVYFGLLPAGIPIGKFDGCGGGDGRVATGFVGNLPAAAHEIGHAFGRDHAPSGDCKLPFEQLPANVDIHYPIYDALPQGSIGEFGIDALGVVKNPAYMYDFMGYCDPTWISLYTYEALRQHFPAVPSSPHTQSLTLELSRDLRHVLSQHLFLSFRIYRGGKIEVFPSFHYLSLPTIKPGKWTPYAIELRDRDDKVLHAQRIWLTDAYKDLDSASLDFYKPIPFHQETVRVVFTCGSIEDCEQKELFAVDVPSDPPEVNIVSPIPKEGSQLSGKVRVAWKAQYGDKSLHYLLRYSRDGGQSWQTIVPRLSVTEYEVDLDRLPGGNTSQFQVLATEGIRTGMAVSETFSVPQKRRETTIIVPISGTTVDLGQTVTFVGESFSPDNGTAHPFEMQWSSDLDGLLGAGKTIYASRLQAGLHTISLRAPDGYSDFSIASIQLKVEVPVIL